MPFIIAHPTAKVGATCSALTGHLDLLPTFFGLAGLPVKATTHSEGPARSRLLVAIFHSRKGEFEGGTPRDSLQLRWPVNGDGDFLNKTMDTNL